MSTDNSIPVKHKIFIKATEEQRVIIVAPEAYQKFLTRLELASEPNAALRRTMQVHTLWDQEK